MSNYITTLAVNNSNVNVITINGYQFKCKMLSVSSGNVPYITVKDAVGKIKHIFCHAISTIEELG